VITGKNTLSYNDTYEVLQCYINGESVNLVNLYPSFNSRLDSTVSLPGIEAPDPAPKFTLLGTLDS
jgi:hypothetical protein